MDSELLCAMTYHSTHRHEALLRVVYASSESLQGALGDLEELLRGTNIWIAVNSQRHAMMRDWPGPPRRALISFPDEETLLRVRDEMHLSNMPDPHAPAFLRYAEAVKMASQMQALLVMVTYEGDIPHDVPLSDFVEDKPTGLLDKLRSFLGR